MVLNPLEAGSHVLLESMVIPFSKITFKTEKNSPIDPPCKINLSISSFIIKNGSRIDK